MVTNVTWGVTSADTSAYLAQYVHDSASYPVDTTDFAKLLAQSAATVNRYVVRAGFDLATLDDDATQVPYLTCQDWTSRLCAARVLRSTVGAAPELADRLESEVMKELREMVEDPALLGAGTDSGGVRAQVSTPTDRLGLDVTETARAKRRYWDHVEGRTSLPDDTHGW